MERPTAPLRTWPLALGLALVTIAAFAGVLANGFVPYDDDLLIYDNPDLRLGLSFAGVRWALTTVQMGNWCPATHLSLLASYAAFAFDPRGWHATDLGLHVGASLLLLASLRRMTGDTLRSALVAGLFALHPLRVESVAWASERRDVLCSFFWMATLWAYARHAELPSRARWAAVVSAFVLALLAKSMAVTLPIVLLLLDVWPLGRIRLVSQGPGAGVGLGPALREKLPLFLLAGAVAALTLVAQRSVGAVQSLDALPLSLRAANALVASVTYLVRFVWPTNLSFFYPFDPNVLTLPRVGGSALVVLGTLVAGLLLVRRRPAVSVGVLWYGVTLLPVIGLVHVGSQASADRYTYLPSVGLAIALAWAIPDAWLRRTAVRRAIVAAGLAWLVALGIASARQVRVWRDGPTLFGHALRVQQGNAMAHYQMGRVLLAAGRPAEALAHLEPAARAMTRSAGALANLGTALGAVGRRDEAIPALEHAVALDPAGFGARFALGRQLLDAGRSADARAQLEQAARREPERPALQLYLALAREQTGDAAGAAAAYRAALRLQPGWERLPGWSAGASGLARSLLAGGGRSAADVAEAVTWAERAVRASGGPERAALETLADAYTAAGREADAARVREQAAAAH